VTHPVAIVGGGIGGLSCAVALRRLGFEAQVFEQAPALEEVGAGIGLWRGAIRCLEELAVGAAFWAARVCPFERAEIGTPDGRVLVELDVAEMTRDAPCFAVRRAQLHAALAAELAPASVTLGARCVGLEQDATGVTVRFADGSEARAQVVIGADGLRSAVRAALFGLREPRYSGETCYRAVTRFAVRDLGILREVQGAGLRAAVHPLDAEHVYWWATRRTAAGQEESAAERKAVLARRFAGWKFGFPEALASTDPEAILKNDLYDRPALRSWTVGRVTLLGDAAHPTTPNLGLGGCMAIEDGLVLARALALEDADHGRAFRRYEAERMARTTGAVRMSATFGWLGSVTSPVAVRLRELMTAATPAWFVARAFRQQVAFDPGPLRQ
jgi:2-polyprenyl-6-methoxyphenol hydroxylase-like FAD-dependent oxidoreductase